MENRISRVLIVDDMVMNRLVLSSLLASHGIISDQAESGMECIDLCNDNDYDLILLDHRMPDMDGVDTLVRLKELFKQRGVDTPVICHTSREALQNINLYKAAGFADVLIKPIEPKEFFDVIVDYLHDDPGDILQQDETPISGTRLDSDEEDDDPDKINDPRPEIDKLPLWLKIVPHIDLVAGIANCGSADDYLDALYIFYSSIEEKSNEIQSYWQDEDLTMYALKIHSLKSMARLVGAEDIGKLAAKLEAAAREGDSKVIRKDTKELLDKYRDFSKLLSKFDEGEAAGIPVRTVPTEADMTTAEENRDLSHCVLFIHSGQGIVIKGIENKLTTSGFNVISISDEPDRIITNRNNADIIVYYTGLSDNAHIEISMNLLGEISQDDAKILCLIGDMTDLNHAMSANGSQHVTKVYSRPVDFDEFIDDMNYYACLEQNYHYKKSIYVVDDDKSYLPIITHWLSEDYNVSAFNSGTDALNGLSAVIPDLILLDYEMPGLNGSELMNVIRSQYNDPPIPIIFLTGKNNRDHVFRVLEDRPDGYILKTSQRETIIDTIHRFFAETVFRASLYEADKRSKGLNYADN